LPDHHWKNTVQAGGFKRKGTIKKRGKAVLRGGAEMKMEFLKVRRKPDLRKGWAPGRQFSIHEG